MRRGVIEVIRAAMSSPYFILHTLAKKNITPTQADYHPAKRIDSQCASMTLTSILRSISKTAFGFFTGSSRQELGLAASIRLFPVIHGHPLACVAFANHTLVSRRHRLVLCQRPSAAMRRRTSHQAA